MTGTVRETYFYPVKGARGECADALHIDAAVGVTGDRRFAIKRKLDQPDTWLAKVNFRVCVNTPEMAAQTPVVSGVGTRAALAGTWVQELATTLGETELSVLDTKGAYNIVDTNPFEHGPTVSFLNLATLRALEAETGWTIDPRRFRMNVWYDDGQPFSELAWADRFPGVREIMVGTLRLRMQDACERCRAVEANPDTGAYDLPVLKAIEQALRKRGYGGSPHRGSFFVMGFLATPLGDAVITSGSEIRLR